MSDNLDVHVYITQIIYNASILRREMLEVTQHLPSDALDNDMAMDHVQF